jgi:DNA-binding transcriptional LysR family regulator
VDTDLLKTFIEVNRTRHFGRAADNLFLTQSAVSARIRLLEETLGIQLFTRVRNNIQLTPAGKRLLKHAESILNAWQRARQDVALDEEDKTPLSVGGAPSLWDIALQDWLHAVYRAEPRIALQAEAHDETTLVRRLLDGALDLAFLFEPPQAAEFHVEEVANIRLVMVSSTPSLSIDQAVGGDYVMVDWGTSFAITHARLFPDMPPPAIRMGLGRMALAFVLGCGGTTYMAESMVAEHLQDNRLFAVGDAPVIDRKAYAVYAVRSERQELVRSMLNYLSADARKTGENEE